MIVCWEHDWPDCPLKVIGLREIVKSLPNKPIERPNIEAPQCVIEDLYKRRRVSDSTRQLFQHFDEQTKSIDEEIWSKVAKTTVAYYSPERVFLYTYFRKNAIRFELFTGGKAIEGVKNFDPSKGGAKWGVIYLRHDKELPTVIEAIKNSYQFIKEAVKNNEPTGWYAKVEEEEEGNDEA